MTFLENGSIVFPLISAALAWFKQKEDEKKKEQKETIKQFIENFEEIAYKNNNIHIEFIVPNFPNSIQYQYFLEGKSDKWSGF